MPQEPAAKRTGPGQSTRANAEDDIIRRQRNKTTPRKTTGAESSRKDRQSSTGHSRTPSPASSRKSVLGLSSGNSVPVSNKGEKQSSVKRSSRKESASATVNTADTNKALPTSQPYIPLKLVLEKAPGGYLNEHDCLKNKWAREAHIKASTSALLTSFIAGGKSKDDQSSANAGEIEMDFLNVIKINAIGNFFCTHTDIYFGNTPKSAACRMNLDTGSSMTWINKQIYERRCSETGASLGKRLRILVHLRYMGVSEQITGELYENVVFFGSENSIIEKQVFAVVDEKKVPAAKTWRENFGMIGILGIEPSSDSIKNLIDDLEIKAPSISHQLLKKKAPAASVVGLNINIPLESGDNATSTSGSSLATAMGELHFGGFKRSAFSPNEPKWVTADESDSGSGFPLNTKVTHNGKTSDKYVATIDAGAAYIYLPHEVIHEYITTTEQGHKLFHYDSTLKAHYISKDSFHKLKDVVFNFDGANIVLPPQAQVIPSSIFKQWEPSAKDGYLYLTLRNVPSSSIPGSEPVILLGHSWINRYYLIMNYELKKLGIAEVEGKTNYIWKELRDLVSKSSS